MAYHGINFRATSGFTTDGTGETYCLGEAYPTTRGGKTFGFSVSRTSNTRDRDNALDRRLVGLAFQANSAGIVKFYFDLPEGSGTYDVRLALGDPANPQLHRCVIRDGDGGTVLATINDDTGNGGDIGWLDATGVERIGSSGLPNYWPTVNAANRLVFTGSQLVLDLGNHASGTDVTAIAHLSVEKVSTGYTITADGGTYSVSGIDADLKTTRIITADPSSYTWAGVDANLVKATPGAFVITAEAGAYVWTGTDAYRDLAFNAENGTYTTTGYDVSFTLTEPMAYTITAEAGTYTFSGRTVYLLGPGDTIPTTKSSKLAINIGLRL